MSPEVAHLTAHQLLLCAAALEALAENPNVYPSDTIARRARQARAALAMSTEGRSALERPKESHE